MIITACLPPPPVETTAIVQVDQCRSFHSVEAFQEWLKEKGLDLNCHQWRWP